MSVCVSVVIGHTGEQGKTAEPITMPADREIRVGHILDGSECTLASPGEYDGSTCVSAMRAVATITLLTCSYFYYVDLFTSDFYADNWQNKRVVNK